MTVTELYEWAEKNNAQDYEIITRVSTGERAIFRDKEPRGAKVTIRMTSDKIGKSLSLQASNVIIGIPLEKVEDIIRIAEKGER